MDKRWFLKSSPFSHLLGVHVKFSQQRDSTVLTNTLVLKSSPFSHPPHSNVKFTQQEDSTVWTDSLVFKVISLFPPPRCARQIQPAKGQLRRVENLSVSAIMTTMDPHQMAVFFPSNCLLGMIVTNIAESKVLLPVPSSPVTGT